MKVVCHFSNAFLEYCFDIDYTKVSHVHNIYIESFSVFILLCKLASCNHAPFFFSSVMNQKCMTEWCQQHTCKRKRYFGVGDSAVLHVDSEPGGSSQDKIAEERKLKQKCSYPFKLCVLSVSQSIEELWLLLCLLWSSGFYRWKHLHIQCL